MTKGAYSKVRELIAPKIDEDNKTLVVLCQKHLPRIPLKQIKQYVGRAAWELRGGLKKAKKNHTAVKKVDKSHSKK